VKVCHDWSGPVRVRNRFGHIDCAKCGIAKVQLCSGVLSRDVKEKGGCGPLQLKNTISPLSCSPTKLSRPALSTTQSRHLHVCFVDQEKRLIRCGVADKRQSSSPQNTRQALVTVDCIHCPNQHHSLTQSSSSGCSRSQRIPDASPSESKQELSVLVLPFLSA
jgi:hypothetical protein